MATEIISDEQRVSYGTSDYSEVVQARSLYDVRNQDTDILTRAATRYLIPKNPERSVKLYKMLGAPIMRKLVMGTVGRFIAPGSGGTYRLKNKIPAIEAATNFATKGSVYNEAIHSVAGLYQTANLLANPSDNKAVLAFQIGAVAFESSLVSLQRYNRARAISFVNRSLSRGNEFRPEYSNWIGIQPSEVQYADSYMNRQAEAFDPESYFQEQGDNNFFTQIVSPVHDMDMTARYLESA